MTDDDNAATMDSSFKIKVWNGLKLVNSEVLKLLLFDKQLFLSNESDLGVCLNLLSSVVWTFLVLMMDNEFLNEVSSLVLEVKESLIPGALLEKCSLLQTALPEPSVTKLIFESVNIAGFAES